MDILPFIVAHLGSFALFILIYEGISQTSRCVRKYIEQDTLQEVEHTKQLRIDLIRQAVQHDHLHLADVRGALRELDGEYDEEDDETEPALETPPPRVYQGVGRVPNDPQPL
jgi:hypothetical protein